MKQNAQRVRPKLLTLIMAGASFAAAATAAETGTGINTNVDAADAHMNMYISMSGNANSNAQWQSGAARGEDRAAERMHAQRAELRQSAGADLTDVDKATAQRNR